MVVVRSEAGLEMRLSPERINKLVTSKVVTKPSKDTGNCLRIIEIQTKRYTNYAIFLVDFFFCFL